MTRWVASLPLICFLVITAACDRVDETKLAAQVRVLTDETPAWVAGTKLGARLWQIEKSFYNETGNRPAWIDGTRPTPQLEELVQALKDADLHGLDQARYDADALSAELEAAREQRRASFSELRVPDLDVRLTYAFLSYAADLLGWSSSPTDVDPNWVAVPVKADLKAGLRSAIERKQVRATLDGYAPSHPQYAGLQAALARLRQQPAAEGSDAARQQEILRMNLERWRWMPRDLGDTHILVNVPGYMMQVVEHGDPTLAMRVIVGAAKTATPLFSDQMTYVVFSPYWNIPTKILREETLPRLARDPDYLRRNNLEVVGTSGHVVVRASDEEDDDGEAVDAIDWSDPEAVKGLRLRQAPGPSNALGLVKFIFPNHFDVYLHDTPNDRLFNKPKRALSHGCIRIENPVGLAEYVLRDRPEWTQPRIRNAMSSATEQSVTLKKPLPVHLAYFTVWAGADGSVSFLDDPYGLDAKQMSLKN